ncbi:MAG TPA: tetratricopeptide repeat protein [Gaiellaceae bacterium]
MPETKIVLLGGFSAEVDGRPVPDGAWRLKKARELMKLLALAPQRRRHREQAMDIFWREKSPDAAANNLHQALHVARRVLGPDAIELRDELLHLSPEVVVDVDEFERAAVDARRTGTPAAYRAALALYGGELLPENRYEDWVESRRDELAELSAALAEELAELGVDEGIRGLPIEATSFVGRERELDQLRTLLGGTRLLTLTGAGGAGKTRLALELGRGVDASFGDGAAFVELAPVAEAAHVLEAVAAALDVRALPGRVLDAAVAEFLAERSLLLVLDNCEHVLFAAAAVADLLLRSAPGVSIVATSREPLRVQGETVFRVPSLALPDPEKPVELAELLGYESIRLFVERAGAAAPGFALEERNARDVVRICYRLDGLPLAIELAAARLGALGADAIAERLDDRFRLLRAGSHSAPTRQQTLEATLEWSHELLADDERTLLRRLAVFAGGFDLPGVEAVCSGESLDRREVADVLARLVEKSLVAADDRVRDRRYRLLETVRLYAGQRLADVDETASVAKSHAEWALDLAERERGEPRLDRDAANLQAGLDTLLAVDKPAALRLCVALGPFWLRRIELEEGHRRIQEALAAVPERDETREAALLAASALDLRAARLERAEAAIDECMAIAQEIGDARSHWLALHFLGGVAISRDDSASAVETFEQALDLARREGFDGAAALGVYSLGVARWRLGELEGVERLVEESIAEFERLGDTSELIPTPISVVDIRRGVASGLGPRRVFEDTLQPFVEISCSAAVGYVLANQAQIARERGHPERSRKLLDESIAVFRRESDLRGESDALIRRAHLELATANLDAARASFDQALELRRRLRDRRGIGMALSGLGLVDAAAGDYERAEQLLAEARDLFRRAGDRWGLTGALWNSADVAVTRGDPDAALEELEEALTVQREAGRELWIAQTLTHLAELAFARDEPERAQSLLLEARDLYAAKGDALALAEVEGRLRATAAPR